MQDAREIAITILRLFKAQQPQSGYIIPYSVLAKLSVRKRWAEDQVIDAIQYGIEQGWFVSSPVFVTLTDFGVKEVEYLKDAPRT